MENNFIFWQTQWSSDSLIRLAKNYWLIHRCSCIEKLNEAIEGKTPKEGDNEVTTNEYQIELIALKTASNVITLIYNLFHNPPIFGLDVKLSWITKRTNVSAKSFILSDFSFPICAIELTISIFSHTFYFQDSNNQHEPIIDPQNSLEIRSSERRKNILILQRQLLKNTRQHIIVLPRPQSNLENQMSRHVRNPVNPPVHTTAIKLNQRRASL